MRGSRLRQIFFLVYLSFVNSIAYAWDHSIALGLGYSHDTNNTQYNNSGLLLSGDLLPICHTSWTYWSIIAAIGQWYNTAPHNQNLTTVALAPALRFYPYTTAPAYPAYVLLSAGPALISSRKFGLNVQAHNITIQSNIGVGVEFNHFDVNLRFVHFSNANTAKPNNGFNILHVLSIGYLF